MNTHFGKKHHPQKTFREGGDKEEVVNTGKYDLELLHLNGQLVKV